jgi:hypothetical protein
LLPRVMRWVAQQNKEGGRRPGDICGAIQCVALGPQCVALGPQCVALGPQCVALGLRRSDYNGVANFKSPNRGTR